MCGRFFVAVDDPELRQILREIEKENKRRGLSGLPPIKTGEVFPTEHAAAVIAPAGGGRRYEQMKWGFSGFDGKRPLINARSETVRERPTFRKAVMESRCLIPASYYYEWMKHPAIRKKIRNIMRDPLSTTLYMAGIYRMESYDDVPCFVILTRKAARGIENIHDRMPVILDHEEQQEWLSKDANIPRIIEKSVERILSTPEDEPGLQ
ncbi:MAG: SOS response-associated peptidase [Clostridiales bacterium]|jgi:putative SOS response-associated peptidase YedK|nr:SOS response-associated peptidase [Clostridiales bacterium]